VTSTPCGVCSTCVEITEGRSVDLIEVDAASRTGVDDMRELLDNVQYMPSVSRFKIYLIDEVHMLSRSSFNAMLKTLEEPPEHVKFLFATTDPKKLPITVLSRCLQFNLKNLSAEQIVHHLAEVLPKEDIEFDESALWQLGRAADGSMRDALSLTDQAISFGNNEVREASVSDMLGSIDQREIFEILEAVLNEDGMKLLDCIARLSEFAPDYTALLDNVLSVLHRLAIAKAVPGAVDNSHGDREEILATAAKVSSEQVQLLYQIGLIGQRDLHLAPMPRSGLEMVLLRMMSFVPDSLEPKVHGNPSKSASALNAVSVARGPETASTRAKDTSSERAATVTPSSKLAGLLSVINADSQPITDVNKEPSAAINKEPSAAINKEPSAVVNKEPSAVLNKEPSAVLNKEPSNPNKDVPTTDKNVNHLQALAAIPVLAPASWADVLNLLGLAGVTKTLAANCYLELNDAGHCMLVLNEHHASLWNGSHETRIATALSKLYGSEIKVSIRVGIADAETPAQQLDREQQENLAQAVIDIENDANVRRLIESFNGKLDLNSIAPLSRLGE
jgi:DNA polymerase III subunit gamma/tau